MGDAEWLRGLLANPQVQQHKSIWLQPQIVERLNAIADRLRALDKPTEELRERVARAISIPEHHTTWDTLSETDKDLYYMQADYAIAALQDGV